jgi:retinol dehydrogenase-12
MSVLGFIYHSLKSQWFMSVPKQNATFAGQTVIITGGNTGLGLEAAKYMVSHKAAKVIIACRSVAKGQAAKKKLEVESGTTDVVELWELDLALYSSIKAFALKASTELDRLDVVICSAGISTAKFTLVNDIESMISINVVSTFLLALLLLPKLKATAAKHPETTPHLAIVSSDTHYVASLDEQNRNEDELIFDQLNDKRRASMVARYPLSKLLDILMTQQLVANLSADYPVIINTINPGLCYSDLQREGPKIFQTVLYTLLHARTAEQGIWNYVFGVSAGQEWQGKYISDCQEGPLGPSARGEKAEVIGRRVWKELTDLLEKIEPGIVSRL